jgi:hypothetical protein
MGIPMGSDEHLMLAGRGNPLGHFEFLPFVGVNEKILAANGGSWDYPPRLAKGWEGSPKLDSLYKLATQEISNHMERLPVWAFKDPRTCLTLPFWRRLLPYPIDCVVILRNPLSVAESLLARNGIPLERGVALWQMYLSSMREGLAGLRSQFFLYDEFLNSCDQEIGRLEVFIRCRKSDWSAARTFVSQSLRNHVHDLEDLRAHPSVPLSAVNLYLDLVASISRDPS